MNREFQASPDKPFLASRATLLGSRVKVETFHCARSRVTVTSHNGRIYISASVAKAARRLQLTVAALAAGLWLLIAGEVLAAFASGRVAHILDSVTGALQVAR